MTTGMSDTRFVTVPRPEVSRLRLRPNRVVFRSGSRETSDAVTSRVPKSYDFDYVQIASDFVAEVVRLLLDRKSVV